MSELLNQTLLQVLTFFNTRSLSLSPPVVSRPTSGAAVDRYESDRQQHTVINFMDTTKDRRAEDEMTRATTVEHGQGGEEEEYDDEYYYEEEYEDGMSGDYDMDVPRGKRSHLPLFFLHFLTFLTQTMTCNSAFAPLFGFSVQVEPTQRPVCHPGDREHRSKEERKGEKEGERKGKEEEPVPEEVQGFLHSWHLPVP